LAWLERAGDRRYVESETRIGRGDRNNFQLNDPSISRDHALIRRVEGDYVLSDLDSSNGTFVNDERVYEPRHLSPGDRVRLANVEFSFNIDQPALGAMQDFLDRPLATSISQFLTISARINTQDYLEGDLRVVTVLFLDLCGFTALSERMSPEQITVVVNQCFQHLTETATRYGGFVDKYIGDAMMVLFGAPRAHDDDAERSVRAAIAMQERLAQFSRRLKQRSGIALQMRVGINTGEVLAGAVGSGQFTAFTVMGDAVNLASRLEEHARVGRILVSEATYQLTRHAVQYGAGTTTSIRGKLEHVNAFEVEGLVFEGPTDEPTHFVGRARESAELERLLAQTGRCRTALLRGPAGSGKSRLVEQLRRTHAGSAEFVAIRSSDFAERGPSVAGRSLVHVLQQRIAARPTLVDAADLPTQPGEPDIEDAPQSGAWLEILATSAATLLRSLARERPLLVCLDRVDLADAATLSLLQSAVARLEDCDVLLLVSTRGSPTGGWPLDAHVLEVPPLSADECLALLRATTGGVGIDPAAAERLVALSGALPGPLLELTQAALQTQQLQQVDGELRLAVPFDIRRAFAIRGRVQAQLDDLTLQDRNVLYLCTIVGASVPTAVLADALALAPDAAAEALERLVGLGYLERSGVPPTGEDSSYAVCDQLTRLVIEASLTQLERRRLHERVALALQHTYDPGLPDPLGLLRIAQHFAASGQAWHSVEYLLRSADLSATSATVEGAVEFYRSVLNEAPSLSDARERARLTLEVQDRIGEALLWGGSLAEAQIAFEQAAENSASHQRRAELQLKLGVIGLRRGNPRRVFQIGRAVLSHPDAPLAIRVGGTALVALARAAQGMLRDALEYADNTLRLAVDDGDPGLVGLAHFAIGRAQFLAGDLIAARQELQQSVAARDEAADVTAAAESRIQLGMIQRALGALDDAEQTVRNALERPGPTVSAGAAVASRQPAAAQWRHRWALASAALVLGRLRLDRGDATRARRHFASAFRAAEALAAREMALEARVELGNLEASSPTSTQTPESLARVLDELRSVLDAALALELRPLACRTRIVLGTVLCSEAAMVSPASSSAPARSREAALLARDALVHARSLGLKIESAGARQLLATALAQLGYWPQAAREFDTATAELEQLGAKVDLVRALIASAGVEHRFGPPAHPDSVRSRLTRAAQLAETIGLSQDREVALGLLSAAGA
jgi:class 3 adenylate cyclase/tetratricopeptide (TPR) repeat protein